MAEKIKNHLMRKKFHYLLPMLVVAISIGVYLSLFGGREVLAVSGVTLTDTDTSGYGLDGRDFTVSWTPGVQPAGYESTIIYIVSSTASTTLSLTNFNVNGCNGVPCTAKGSLNFHAESSWTLPDFFTTDSAGEAFVTNTSYVAYVFTSSTAPTFVSSTAVSYAAAFDEPTDNNPPQVDHLSVNSTEAGSNALFYAFIFDDQTASSSFNFIDLAYGADVSTSRTTSTGVYVANSGDLFRFSVPSEAVGANGNSLEYYIMVQDASGNTRYICNNFNAANAVDCQTQPFTVNTIAAAGGDGVSLIGSITSGGTPLVGASVFLGGLGKAAVTSNGSGVYTFTSVPTSTVYDITATKTGFCDQTRMETVTTTSRVGLNIMLNSGNCGYDAGGGGAPYVVFSGPPNGDNFASIDVSVRVGFSQSLDATTVNDTDSTNAGSNIYLTTDDGTTKIAGTVTYCSDNTAQGCSSLFTGDSNVILFDPTANLTTSTFYTLVITSGVKSAGGQSISGNLPGGGHEVRFSTAGATWDPNTQGANYGTGGAFMPPYVKSVVPAPGISSAPNASIVVEFSEAMNSATINSTNLILYNLTTGANVTLSSVSLDNSQSKYVTLAHSGLTAGNNYEVRIKGAVANASGMTIGDPTNSTVNVFVSNFMVSSGGNDTGAPTLFPLLGNNSTGVSVNQIFEFGFSEQLAVSTINTSNVTMRRGSNSVAATVQYDPGVNTVFVSPNSALAPNTAYTITFSASVTDLASNAISATTYNYTTGAADTTSPEAMEARCDDYTCAVFFTESMTHDSQTGANWATSVINSTNWILERTAPSSQTIDLSGKSIIYSETGRSATVNGFSGLASSNNFRLTLNAGVTDLSLNTISATSRILNGTVEASTSTYGNFGGGGMFGPPTAGGGSAGGQFIPEGFGSFTGEQFMFGQADMAFPFSQMASQDVNVFQTRFTPGQALQTGDIIQLTFPSGTTIDNAVPDSFSPFYSDLNDFGAGAITFDTTYMGDGVGVSSTALQVKIRVSVSGTLDANDPVVVDLKKITNPSVPKGPTTGGYTLGIKVLRAGAVIINKTSMPYFINEGGTNNLTVRIFAGAATTTPITGANGTIFMFGGGPSGPMDKSVTLTDGIISAVDSSATTSIGFYNIPNGCYFFGTDPFATLGGKDYFGAFSPEPTCVEGGQSLTKDILFTPAGGTASVTTTISIVGVNFAGADVDVFAGGPGRFVVKTLSNMGDYSATATSTSIQLPANGKWFVGVAPAMSKGGSTSKPTSLPGVPPSPIEIIAAGVGTVSPTVSPGFGSPVGTSFNNDTDTITFTFAVADKTISGTLTDGTNALANVEVFVHQNGFGAPVFDTTDNNGAFSLAVSQYGSYEIGAFKAGLPPVFKQVEIKADSAADADSDPDVYYRGKLITGLNPLALTIKKPAYYISGKVLDSSGNGISYAPVFASNDSTGDFVGGGTGSDGSYTIFVDNGTWTVRSELPPSKSDTCGKLTTSVIVASANKTSQNLSPSVSTCYSLGGTVSVGGTALANVPIFVEQWDSTNSRPSTGGFMKGASTDSDGVFSVKVGNGTYRIGTWHPDYGELSATATVNGAAVTNANVTVATTATVTVSFTGGTSTMDAFVELKNSSDKTKRIGKQHKGLNTDLTLTVQDGITYNYFVDVFGIGKFTGAVVAGGTATVDVSTSNYLTVSGNIADADGTALSGALVSFVNNTTDIVQTVLTDASGNYSAKVNADTYNVSASLAGYIPGQATQAATFTADTTGYSFGAGQEQAALAAADQTIEGTLRDSTGTAMSDGYVWATNANGIVVEAAIDPDDGTYSLPVVDGVWTVEGTGPRHDKTALSGALTIAGADLTGNNFNLTANADKVPTSTSGVIASNTGGSVNDINSSGIKLTAGSGVLAAGSSDITVNMERSYDAPDSENFDALSNAIFEITASGASTIKNLTGNVEIQIDYSGLIGDLPTGVTEAELQLMYYSAERGEYVPVEGGFIIDAANNTITGLVDHFTPFVVTYNPPVAAAAAAASAASGNGSGVGPNPPSALVQGEKLFAPTAQATASSEYALNEAKEVSVGASVHTITVLEATATLAKVKIESEPIEVVLTKNEAKDIDTNNDGYNDLRATYTGFINGKVAIDFVNLSDEGELVNAITINAGSYETSSRNVKLKFNLKNVKQMAVSNSNDFTGLSFVDYKDSLDWELTEGNGKKTIYAKFRSEAGGILETNDTIILTGQEFDQVDSSGACPLTIGASYKLKNSPGVYYITDDCTKRPFRNSRVFFTYFSNWSDVNVVDAKVLNSVPNDEITFMPWGFKYNPKGGALVKVITDPKVFLLMGTKSFWVASETLFDALGYAWNWIEDISKVLLDKYTRADDITSADQRPENTLIKYKDSVDVYRLEKDANDELKMIKKKVKNETALEKIEQRKDRIIEILDTEIYESGEDIE